MTEHRAAGEGDSSVANAKRAEALGSNDFKSCPVWQFVGDDKAGETLVRGVKSIPVKSPTAKLIGNAFKLANGCEVDGFGGNICCDSARRNQHFLTLSFFCKTGVFHLARYFDAIFEEAGPLAFAAHLNLAIEEVFPIEYDFSAFCRGPKEILRGFYPAEPENRLGLAELAMLAVPVLREKVGVRKGKMKRLK